MKIMPIHMTFGNSAWTSLWDGWHSVLGLIGLAAWYWMRAGKKISGGQGGLSLPKSSLSTAKWLKTALGAPNATTLIGVVSTGGFFKRAEPWVVGQEHRERHMQIVGPTRSGKSQLLLSICVQDMAAGRPVFLMEAKGDVSDFEQFKALAGLAKRTDDLRYFNPADPSSSMTFNPILPIPGQELSSLANQISRAIGREPGGGGDSEYFRGLDYARIQNMAEVFMATGRAFTLRDVFFYFEYEECREQAFRLCPDKRLVRFTRRQFDGRPDTSALTSSLQPWISGDLGRLLNSYAPQIRLEEIFEGRQLAYFAIPIGHLQVQANALGRMVIAGLLSEASRRQRMAVKPTPGVIILDEFSKFATPAFSDFISTVGSARLWTIFSHQDLGQLKKVVGTPPDAFFSELFSNSSGCKVFFHLPHPADADLIARAVGTFSNFKATEMYEGGSSSGRKSIREVEEFFCHPNVLRGLPPGVAVAWGHRKRAVILFTAAAHEALTGKEAAALPKVQGVLKEGLDLASAAPASRRGNRDFTGSPAGPAGER